MSTLADFQSASQLRETSFTVVTLEMRSSGIPQHCVLVHASLPSPLTDW